MIQAIIKGIFALIMGLFTALLAPFVAIISALFPDLTNAFNAVSYFINLGLTYVPSVMRLLMIDHNSVVLFFDYLLITYSIYYSCLAVRFCVNVYNKLKI